MLKEDDSVCSSEVETQPTNVGRQQQHVHRRVRVEPAQITKKGAILRNAIMILIISTPAKEGKWNVIILLF